MEQKEQGTLCPAKTKKGGLCLTPIVDGSSFCYKHDPARAEQRRRAATKASRSRPVTENAALRRRLTKLLDEVLKGDSDPKLAGAASVLANSIIGSLRLDLKIKEIEDIAARLERIEDTIEGKRRF